MSFQAQTVLKTGVKWQRSQKSMNGGGLAPISNWNHLTTTGQAPLLLRLETTSLLWSMSSMMGTLLRDSPKENTNNEWVSPKGNPTN